MDEHDVEVGSEPRPDDSAQAPRRRDHDDHYYATPDPVDDHYYATPDWAEDHGRRRPNERTRARPDTASHPVQTPKIDRAVTPQPPEPTPDSTVTAQPHNELPEPTPDSTATPQPHDELPKPTPDSTVTPQPHDEPPKPTIIVADHEPDDARPVDGAPRAIVEETTDPISLHESGTPCLVLTTANGEERSFPLGDLNILVGRSKAADIVTEGDGVALFHVRIEPTKDGRHRVIDLDARSGTLHNGTPIEQVVLETGDVITLGDTELRYTRGLTSLRNPPVVQPSVAIRTPKDSGALLSTMAEPSVLVETASPAQSGLMRPPPLASELPVPPTSAQIVRSTGTGPVATVGLPEPDVIDRLAQMVAFWRRYRPLLLALPVLGLVVGLLSPQFIPPPMIARFELSLVQDPSDNPVDPAVRRNLTFFRSAQDNFLGPELIERTLEELGEPEPDATTINDTQQLLAFERASQYIYHGSYEAPEGEDAIAFLKVHLDLFLETEVDKAIKVLTAEVDTLRKELEDVDEELSSVETTRVAFKMEAGEAQPEHTLALRRRMLELRDDRREAAALADRMKASVDIARQRLGSEDKLIEQRIEDARPFSDEIVATEKELIEARASGQGAEHPNIKGLQARLSALEDRHQELLDKGGDRIEVRSNPAYSRAKLSLNEARSLQKVARGDLARTEAEIAQLEEVLGDLPAREAEQAALDRRYEALQTQHNELQIRLGSSELQLALERRQVEARFELVQPPTLEPLSDRNVLLTRAGLGTLLGLVVAVMLGMSHTTWERVGERLAEQQREPIDLVDGPLPHERAIAVRQAHNVSPRPSTNRYRAVERKRRVTRPHAHLRNHQHNDRPRRRS
ncbi:MAG: FHA domain-containing protein [Myxococcota bacterium]